jgi:hypothetical protein
MPNNEGDDLDEVLEQPEEPELSWSDAALARAVRAFAERFKASLGDQVIPAIAAAAILANRLVESQVGQLEIVLDGPVIIRVTAERPNTPQDQNAWWIINKATEKR